MNNMPPRGPFVTFEGGEGAGKSTQVIALAERARDEGLTVLTCREPGGTLLGEHLRAALFGLAEAPSPLAELFTFEAARVELVTTVIRPTLELGNMVICDRFSDSTIAYQGYGRGLIRATIDQVNALGSGGVVPDVTVLLDIAPAAGRARAIVKGTDYVERESLEFHERVRKGFLELARAEPGRWLVLDATKPRAVLAATIWSHLTPLLSR